MIAPSRSGVSSTANRVAKRRRAGLGDEPASLSGSARSDSPVHRPPRQSPACRGPARRPAMDWRASTCRRCSISLSTWTGISRSRLGALMRKIDPKCPQKLLEELNQPIRRRRIRACGAAEALGFAPDVEGGLLAMLSYGDSIVRRVAAELLVCVPSPEVIVGLTALLQDSSPRVCDAAERSLAEIGRSKHSASDRPVPQPVS